MSANLTSAAGELDRSQRTVLPVVLAIAGYAADDTDALLRAALSEARSRHAALHVLHVFGREPDYLPIRGYAYEPPQTLDHLRHIADQTIAAVLARLAALAGPEDSAQVTGEAISGRVVPELLDVSARSSVLFLGSRRHSVVDLVFLGSVGTALAARGHCPVVIVRSLASAADATPERVVVGITSDAAADELLRFGFDYARRHNLAVRVVHCWRPDPLAIHDRPPWRYARQAATVAANDVAAAWGREYPDVVAEGVAVMDYTVHGLLDAAGTRALLVVGRHGHHAFAGTLLGSVSQGVLHHAPGWVAIVPTRQ